MSAALHLVRCRLNTQRLYAFARRSRAANVREFDTGYAVHALFAALFDHGAPADARVAPKPFHIAEAGGHTLDVLGYAHMGHSELEDRATTFGDPSAWGVCDLAELASKPMPSAFEPGTRLGFSVRACPVQRIAKRGPMDRDRAEVDAFLARSWEVGANVPLTRHEVYRAWLEDDLGKEGAARILDAAVTSFRLGRLHRRTQGAERRGHLTARPDVTFEGTLEVASADAFMHRLARGVGRHRAFGFGMLLLKPAQPVVTRDHGT
jgi:CRISPR system Cascade subunit CasE